MPSATITFASKRQPAAIRANAKLSTGPKSEEGKHRSSQGALRHGLTGRAVALPAEDTSACRRFSKEIVESLRPETPVERNLAQTPVDSQWRLNRVFPAENSIFAPGAPPDVDLIPDNPKPDTANALKSAWVACHSRARSNPQRRRPGRQNRVTFADGKEGFDGSENRKKDCRTNEPSNYMKTNPLPQNQNPAKTRQNPG